MQYLWRFGRGAISEIQFSLLSGALSIEWLKSLLLQQLEEHFFWRDRRQFGKLNLGDVGEVW